MDDIRFFFDFAKEISDNILWFYRISCENSYLCRMTATEVLSKLLLPTNSDWSIGSVDIDEQKEEVRIELVYNNQMVITEL